nr:apolipoprotein N-acyltransferase [Sphingomonas jejuensis]
MLSATGFQPLGAWPLTLLAFAGVLLLLRTAPSLRAALATGWLFGFGQFVLGLNWIATAFTYQAAMPAWLGWIAVVLLSIYLAVYPALAAGIAWRWGRRDRLSLTLALAAAWIVTEWLRATMFTGFAWNPVGVVLLPSSLSETSALVGTYGLSGIVVLLGGLLLFVLSADGWRKGAAVPLLALVAINLRPPPAPPTDIRVHVVQPNIGQAEKWQRGFEARNRARHVALSGQPDGRPRLLLWPEAAVPDFLEEEPAVRRELARLLGPGDLLLTGGSALEWDIPTGRVAGARNSVFALTPDARLIGRYDKAHLVPYGEYLPMRPILSAIGLSRLAPGDLDFWAGPGPRTLMLPGFGPVGLQICYEIIFSGQVVEPGARPRFIFNPSNDAWFGSWGPPQHLAQARLRAIEEGLPVVRATPTGISAVIDPRGRLVRTVPGGVAGVIQLNVPAARQPTPFAQAGNILPFLFALVLAGLTVVSRRRAG